MLKANDGPLAVGSDFTEGRFEPFGRHGTICWYIYDEYCLRDDGRKTCTANHAFRYDGFRLEGDGALLLNDAALVKNIREGRDVRFMIVGNDGRMILANVSR